MNLESLEKQIERDLAKINCPPKPWRFEEEGIYDVVIIGAGMAGLQVAVALRKLGILKVQLFDENPQRLEGPWITYARMVTLRSPKNWMGPALGIPSLTFESWFEAKFGISAWEDLGKIPKEQWMEYLIWYRNVLKIPVKNETKLLSITPKKEYLKLQLSNQEILTYKVVLATGRSGFGGSQIPPFFESIPKSKWSHTNERIDFSLLEGKQIAVIGGGDSGFNAAQVALNHHAKKVDLFARRTSIPNTNPARELFFCGCYMGYYQLKDDEKWKVLSHIFEKGITPPREALELISKCPNFHVYEDTKIESVYDLYDYYILATGLAVDGLKQPELKHLMPNILLWEDKGFKNPPKMGRFPYLGPHFEFLEKKKGRAPYLKNIHCFNYGSHLSLGHLGSEIPSMPFGAELLAFGITADFFLKDRKKHYSKFKNYDDPEYLREEFLFFNP